MFGQIEKKREYSLEEISRLMEVPIPTLRVWRDLGAFTPDKTRARRLAYRADKNTILGRDLVDFLYRVRPMPLS